MALELPHIPFMSKMRLKNLDGVYRHKEEKHIAIFKNCHRLGYVKEDSEGHVTAYDAITVSLNSEQHGKFRRCMIDLDEWEKVLDL